MALGWAMSVLGPGGGWDDYEALEDQADAGQISQDQWSVKADKVSHDLWAGFDVVANVCGTSAVGSSAAALPLLGSSKVASRVLGSLADDAVEGAAATRVGSGFGAEAGATPVARDVVDGLLGGRSVSQGRFQVEVHRNVASSTRQPSDSARAASRGASVMVDLCKRLMDDLQAAALYGLRRSRDSHLRA